jgi:hypothetical protein
MAAEQYAMFQELVGVFQGAKIQEGNVWEKLIYEVVRDAGRYSMVANGFPVLLLHDEEKKGARKNHKVDIFCKDDDKMVIHAYNSKGKSFNNTESPESLCKEYQLYKASIEHAHPGYAVTYAILKDEYDCKDGKMSKYKYLEANGIPVFNTKTYLMEEYGISTDEIEKKRQMRTIELVQERFKKTGITQEQLRLLTTGVSSE